MCRKYKQRYAEGAPDLVQIGIFASKTKTLPNGRPVPVKFECGKIEQLLAAGEIPDWIAEQCVYANPELLEQCNHGKTNNQKLDANSVSSGQDSKDPSLGNGGASGPREGDT
jgi:hypothetical protein